ncbi:glycosyltransferase family 9 protein [Elioraea tepida]|uniref:Glycosyltransferase family 9 protein n=1 Tax=Elioraea tepida TaxID=2843330 RepID=A0A975U105_9PROT|nr:glycosyltransferase family 9 protein [Elioraea tepida]QXM24391.1 glycosyltransferase family 9 protein [Elioraea tepida]
MSRILVIKHGALGDLVQAFGPFAAIRAHHPSATITLLTTPPFAPLMAKAPWFDRIEVDHRPPSWNLFAWRRLGRRLAAAGYRRVYDLQTSDRSARIFLAMRLYGARPEWSGIAPAASHPHDNPNRTAMHTLDRQREQLEMAGITDFPPPELGWLVGDAGRFGLPRPFALLVPGASPHRPGKRWPADGYGALAAHLVRVGLTPVILGTAAEAEIAASIRRLCRHAIDLTGRTGLDDIAALAAAATLAVGNDTGPMHLIAVMGTPSLVLFSADSDPALCAPRGPRDTVRILRVPDLRTLAPETVIASLPAP